MVVRSISQILTQELISGLVQSAQVLDSGANQWSGSVRADLAIASLGCEIVCIINAKASDVLHRMKHHLFGCSTWHTVRWTVEPSADDRQQKRGCICSVDEGIAVVACEREASCDIEA